MSKEWDCAGLGFGPDGYTVVKERIYKKFLCVLEVDRTEPTGYRIHHRSPSLLACSPAHPHSSPASTHIQFLRKEGGLHHITE